MANAETNPRADALFAATREAVIASAVTPLSTYRVQLHKGFDFAQASAIVPYLARLGVDHLYVSPYLKALPGSTHGYDVVDHGAINPEIGTAVEHAAFCETLASAGLGQVLDTVPNHMGIVRDNALWEDVLENGEAAVHAQFFDIDWDPVKTELRGKVLLPVLGDQYGAVLERGELSLAYNGSGFEVRYFDRTFPVNPRGYREILESDLGRLEGALSVSHPDYVELQSVITGLRNLPGRGDTEQPKVLERNREKEVLKRRLGVLTAANPAIASHVERAVARFNGTPGEPRTFDLLDRLLDRYCPYRLAHWRVAGEEINYRRFFDINGLAAIRVEVPEVFDEAHRLVLQFLGAGQVQGLRIDHPDGLFEPTRYFLELQEAYFLERARRLAGDAGSDERSWTALAQAVRALWWAEVARDSDSPLRKALYVVVEKIQGGKERIPEDWAVHGTTGYRFANLVTGLLVDASQERAFTDLYARVTLQDWDFGQLVVEKKSLVMRGAMASEINGLARELNRISELDRHTRDFTLDALRRALVAFIAHFPVYRTYVDGREGLDEGDARYIRWTVAQARAADRTTSDSIFDFLQDILLKHYPEHLDAAQRGVMLRFAMKLQQLTGPVMAKGMEDTAFYVYNRLVALNEVGGEPEHFGTALGTFHLRNADRQRDWPAALVATTTHDTKRSEDLRARLVVLTELGETWRNLVRRWSKLNALHKTSWKEGLAPSANDEYLFYQTVVGAWPMGAPSAEELRSFAERVQAYLLKAIKEAKVHTSWTNPNAEYEEATRRFVERALSPDASRSFFAQAEAFKRELEPPGQLNALTQVLLKMTSPGTPDVYQGCELWDLSLVDPDNRRPVDFAARARLLEALDRAAERDPLAVARETWANPSDGRCKLWLTTQALRLRKRRGELFRRGAYRPLTATGARADRIVAFARTHGGESVVAVAPRLAASALSGGGLSRAYQGTAVQLDAELQTSAFRNVLTGERIRATNGGLPADALFAAFPVALLEGEG